MAKDTSANEAIRTAFEASGLTKREVARQLYGDGERWREFDRYLKTTRPRASAAVPLARILGQPSAAFLTGTPLEEIARELGEANRLGRSFDCRLQELEDTLAMVVSALEALAGPAGRRAGRGGR